MVPVMEKHVNLDKLRLCHEDSLVRHFTNESWRLPPTTDLFYLMQIVLREIGEGR